MAFTTPPGLWAVVNNAGITDWAEIEWSTFEDFRNMIDVNLFGSIRTSIAFLPLVRAAKGKVALKSMWPHTPFVLMMLKEMDD